MVHGVGFDAALAPCLRDFSDVGRLE